MASTKKNEAGIKQSTLLKWEINATSESLYLKMFRWSSNKSNIATALKIKTNKQTKLQEISGSSTGA